MLKYANDAEMNRLGDILMRNLESLFEGIEVCISTIISAAHRVIFTISIHDLDSRHGLAPTMQEQIMM